MKQLLWLTILLSVLLVPFLAVRGIPTGNIGNSLVENATFELWASDNATYWSTSDLNITDSQETGDYIDGGNSCEITIIGPQESETFYYYSDEIDIMTDSQYYFGIYVKENLPNITVTPWLYFYSSSGSWDGPSADEKESASYSIDQGAWQFLVNSETDSMYDIVRFVVEVSIEGAGGSFLLDGAYLYDEEFQEFQKPFTLLIVLLGFCLIIPMIQKWKFRK